ncbi:amidase signature enzyme [Acaromyces ingoldii]|uniref:Glutamyl-tRNA(Gln) amidotransferase subunit A, mitochondrial n=1 Tax=Acaromyces ingoldii TaxID=215250 RepID=A0A316YWR3_9BASI|nr:amidase signature enzyme [Acaromyces ingoldii]PWN93486.1 amidase signature enzyme [Acaromyces ingoldii]
MSARAALRRSRQACWRCQSTLPIANSKVNANNAYIHIPNEAAKPRSQTKDDGLLAGWPTSIKANLCTADGLPTSCASKMLEDYVSPFEATAIGLLRSQGADIVGKTNCDEFGMGSANVHSAFGAVLNPNDTQSVAGGSSGGAAASVAEGSARIALGSDTGGSVRLPAAYCGVYGLKPSYGLISRWGLVSYADSLDTVGLLARSVDDIDLAFSVINAFDEQDPTAIDDDVRQEAVIAMNETVALTSGDDARPLEGLRVGIPHEYFPKELAHRTLGPLRETLRSMQRAGATLVPVNLPRTEVALSAYYVIASAEASSNLARYDGIRYGHRSNDDTGSEAPLDFHSHISRNRSSGFGPEVKRRILLGTYALTADAFDNYFLQAQRVRQLVRDDFDGVLRVRNVLRKQSSSTREDGVDILVHPATVDTAPRVDEQQKEIDGQQQQRQAQMAYVQDVLTVPSSLAGLPSLSIPAGKAQDNGLPVGVALTAQWGCEKLLFHVARSLTQ